MSVEQMRQAITTVYPGDKWKRKVSTMSAGQVIAIYHKFVAARKIS